MLLYTNDDETMNNISHSSEQLEINRLPNAGDLTLGSDDWLFSFSRVPEEEGVGKSCRTASDKISGDQHCVNKEDPSSGKAFPRKSQSPLMCPEL